MLVEEEGRLVPMLARAGNGLYLLGFSDGQKAKKFIGESDLKGAEARLVVKSNLPGVLAALEERKAQGVLVDYDSATNTYKEAGLVF